ncbi:MAG: hypothetical protein OXC07_08025 [Kistimonas sp.]|nr:hypothetical protein [Kistimonas sp.]
MSGIHIAPAPLCAAPSLLTAMAHFEEEKTFFGSMFVIVTPPTKRQVRKESRDRRRRNRSSLGRVIRRSEVGGIMARQEGLETEEAPC